ncbi:hypothetical protein D915_009135 [Fasciola hepatica]|uniref:CRAL-TRIO domain-containing protein n=1 Tax=Fasciola hepatica TaxID=6192 RepID=A0A4E0QY43_FASHE|nr:hypothetical protein D915_009135 [Fasciola hepatica]
MPTVPLNEIKVEEIAELLRTKYAIFTGGHDREFRSLVIFPDYQTENLAEESFVLLLQYLSTMNSTHSSVHAFVMLIDRRTGDWKSVKTIVSRLNTTFPASIDHIYVIKPQGFVQRFFVEKTVSWIREESRFPITFVDKLEELSPFIDSVHLPTDMGGQLCFNIENWLRDRAVVQSILERCFHGLSAGSVPLQFEQFRDRVTLLCERAQQLLDQFGQPSPPVVGVQLQVYLANPSYSPSLMVTWKKQRHKFLDAIDRCEADGLKLRQTLRDGPYYPGESSPVTANDQTGTSNWTHADENFDLPVDRVFHVINLEHTLVKLTETRSVFNQAWRQFTKRAGIIKLMADIEQRFVELEPLAGMWENLLESASDYFQSSRSIGRQQLTNLSTRQPTSASLLTSVSRSSSFDGSCFGLIADPSESTTEDMYLEDLRAVVNRLTEADQFGAGLLPDLLALSKTTQWVVDYIRMEESNVSLDSETSGIEALSRFTFVLDNDSDPDELDSPSSVGTVSSMSSLKLPTIHLPRNAERWASMFRRLLMLAQTKLPNSADQLNRLLQLYSEMNKARSWIRRGVELITPVITNDSFNSWSLEHCHQKLDQLRAYYALREEGNLRGVTDPKFFHQRFSDIITMDLRNALMELLRQMEDVEVQYQTGIALLRQHISRTSFPRHQSSLSSLPSVSTEVSVRDYPVRSLLLITTAMCALMNL